MQIFKRWQFHPFNSSNNCALLLTLGIYGNLTFFDEINFQQRGNADIIGNEGILEKILKESECGKNHTVTVPSRSLKPGFFFCLNNTGNLSKKGDQF
jgi:hypothetical protein